VIRQIFALRKAAVMLEYITQINLSAEEKTKYSNIMRKGNKKLAAHSDRLLGPRQRRTFRKLFFDGKIDLEESCIPEEDAKEIRAVKEIEWTMIQSCIGLIRQIASRWHNRSGASTGSCAEDYGQEAIICFINGIFAYGVSKNSVFNGDKANRKNVTFVTYVYSVVNNGMITFTAKASLLGGLKVQDLINSGKFDKISQKYPELSYDEIVDIAVKGGEFEIDKIKGIEGFSRNIINESQMFSACNNGEEFEAGLYADYTTLDVDNRRQKELVEPDMFDAVENAGLSKAEMDVFTTSLKEYWGWQSDVAERNINPKTGENYTRQWVHQILPSIRIRVQEAYYSSKKV